MGMNPKYMYTPVITVTLTSFWERCNLGWEISFCLPEKLVSHLEPVGKLASATTSLLKDLECLPDFVAVCGLEHLKELLLSSTLIAPLDPYSEITCHPKNRKG